MLILNLYRLKIVNGTHKRKGSSCLWDDFCIGLQVLMRYDIKKWIMYIEWKDELTILESQNKVILYAIKCLFCKIDKYTNNVWLWIFN